MLSTAFLSYNILNKNEENLEKLNKNEIEFLSRNILHYLENERFFRLDLDME